MFIKALVQYSFNHSSSSRPQLPSHLSKALSLLPSLHCTLPDLTLLTSTCPIQIEMRFTLTAIVLALSTAQAALGASQTCTVNNVPGECVSTSSCSANGGKSTAGYW